MVVTTAIPFSALLNIAVRGEFKAVAVFSAIPAVERVTLFYAAGDAAGKRAATAVGLLASIRIPLAAAVKFSSPRDAQFVPCEE